MAQCTPLEQQLGSCTNDWTSFASTIDDILGRLLPINPAVMWPILGDSGLHIGDVSPADFAFKLANISWTLVDASFAAENGGVGEVLSAYHGGEYWDPSDWRSAAEKINAEDFQKYLRLSGGAHYLILHETAHTTRLGLQTNNMQFDQYVQNGGDRNDGAAWAASPQWLYNEQVANAIARTAAQAIGLTILDHPTCGYPETASGPMLRKVITT